MHRKPLHPLEKHLLAQINANNAEGVSLALGVLKRSIQDEKSIKETSLFYREEGLPTLTCRNEHGYTFLLAALVRCCSKKIIKYLLDEFKDSEEVIFGHGYDESLARITPLQEFILRDEPELLESYLEYAEKLGQSTGRKVWLENIENDSPLFYAANNRKTKSLLLILKKISQEKNYLDLINLPNEHGQTPLHILCMYTFLEEDVIKELVAAGADPDVVNNQNLHPIAYIESSEQQRFKRLFAAREKHVPETKPLYLILNEQRLELLKLKITLEMKFAQLKESPHVTTFGRLLGLASSILFMLAGGSGTATLLYKCWNAVSESNSSCDPVMSYFVAVGAPIAGACLSGLTWLGILKNCERAIPAETWQLVVNGFRNEILEILNEIKQASKKDNAVVSIGYKNDVKSLETAFDHLENDLRIRVAENLLEQLIQLINHFLPKLNAVRMSANLLQFKPSELKQEALNVADNERDMESSENKRLLLNFP